MTTGAAQVAAAPLQATPANRRVLSPTSEAERDAERTALLVLGGRTADAPTAGPPRKVGPGAGGEALSSTERAFFEPAFGADLASIRLHPVGRSDLTLFRLGASAAAHRGDIWIRHDALRDQGIRRRLLAHEIAHLIQPEVASGERVGRTVDEWLTGTPAIRTWSYTQLISELDELEAWLERQTTSSADETRVRQSVGELRAEVARRDRETRNAGRARPRPAGRDTELPTRRPRVLSEPTSRVYTDPAEMRAEYDLIMQWLARRDISRAERRMLEIERNNLAPQFATDRARVAGEQRVARLQAALTPSDQEAGRELQVAARVISSIARDDADPGRFWIYQNGERIPISADQASRVRSEIDRQLRRASRMISGDSEDSWNVYQSQLAVNRESPIIGAIAGWLGGASDPGEELIRRRARLVRELRAFDAEVAAGDVVAASGRLARLERQAQVIHGAAAAFRDNHISGAERAVGALEITRDISFAVAGSIAAVLAAPLVAGAVAGAGVTGAGATALTIGGTGLVVGGGEAVVRGGASAGGVLISGGSVREAGRAFVGEGARGFLDGFMAGAGAGAARVLGPALGVGGQVGNQVLRRMAAEAIVNGTAATVDAVIHGASPAQAAQAGLRAAVLALPGALVGSSGNRLVRELVGPLTGGATAYLGAIAAGQSRDEALRAAAVAVAANIVTSRAQHGVEAEQRLEARGRAIGESLRPSARGGGPTSSATPLPATAAVLEHEGPAGAAHDAPTAATPAEPAATGQIESPAPSPASHAPEQVQDVHSPAAGSTATVQSEVPASEGSQAQTPSPTTAQAASGVEVPSAAPAATPHGPAASSATAASPSVPAAAGPRESAGAAPPGTRQHTDPFTGETAQVTASARAPSAVHGHIRGAGAEFEAYHTALRDHGEIGIQRPGRVNEGGPDFITARVLPNGTVEVIVSDATINLNKRTYSTVPTRWYGEIDLAVAPNRLQLGDPVLEAQIRAVVAARVFTMRNLEIRTSPTVAAPAITGW